MIFIKYNICNIVVDVFSCFFFSHIFFHVSIRGILKYTACTVYILHIMISYNWNYDGLCIYIYIYIYACMYTYII